MAVYVERASVRHHADINYFLNMLRTNDGNKEAYLYKSVFKDGIVYVAKRKRDIIGVIAFRKLKKKDIVKIWVFAAIDRKAAEALFRVVYRYAKQKRSEIRCRCSEGIQTNYWMSMLRFQLVDRVFVKNKVMNEWLYKAG